MFADIGIGILTAVFASRLFSLPLTFGFVFVGIVFALLPDVDYLFHLVRGGSARDAHKHRDALHLPLLYIPLGMITLSFYDASWSILFGLCSLLHFLHDSIGIGWGVEWLYPLSNDHYTFFYRYQPPEKEKLPKKLIYVWKHNKIDELAKKYGDEDWIKNIYLDWHPYAIFELLLFLISLTVLYFQLTRKF